MTIWQPAIQELSGPRYRAIADALEREVTSGRLAAGERLPTHRELADQLGLTVGTVTRAYALARRRGLVSGEVGRGTFVRRPGGSEAFAIADPAESGVIDLSLSIAPPERRADLVAARLADIAADPALADWCQYQVHAGHPRHRALGARWLASLGVEADPDDVVVTAGAQHALSVAFTAFARPGDAVLTETLTYPGIQWIADHRGLRLEGVAQDDEGIRPDALRDRARQTGARTVYLTPNLQNPTTACMSATRREAVARVARECDLLIVEDDVYRPMLESPLPALSDFAPERSVFATSFSKGVAAGLRVGFVRAPAGRAAALAAAVRTGMWMVSPLMAELAVRLFEAGDAERMVAWKRREADERCTQASRALDGHPHRAHPASHHLWLPLPPPWRARDFASECLRRGVRVSPSDVFAVSGGGPTEEGVRLSLLAAPTAAALERALVPVRDLLSSGPVASRSVI